MADFYFMQPSEITSLYGTVTITSGTIDSDYVVASLANGNPGVPVRTTAGTATFRNTFAAAGEVGMIVVAHHKLDAAKVITVSNGVSTTVTCGTMPGNGIPLNPYTVVTPVAGVTALDFAISGNSTDIIIGEIFAGKYRSLRRFVYTDDDMEVDADEREPDVDISSVQAYDMGKESRTWSGSVAATAAQRDIIIEWYRSQRGNSRPSVIVPDPTLNDAWVVKMGRPRFSPAGGIYLKADLTFREYPRSRW